MASCQWWTRGNGEIFSIAWGLWGRQNKLLFENWVTTPLQVFESALATREGFQTLTSPPGNQAIHNSCLVPLPLGIFTLNVDGALFPDLNKTRVGFILRDWKGATVIVASISKQNVTNVVDIETLAILRGLQHCLNQGTSNLLIESDC